MKVLIATDGSAFSDAAIGKICQILKNAEKPEVKIVSAYEQPMMAVAAPYVISAAYNPVLETQMKELAMQAVVQGEDTICDQLPALKENLTTRVLCGSPAQAVIEEAENWGADLIVVGSHGRGFWERTFLGSVSGSILNHAPCSVLVVKNTRAENDQNSK